MCLNNMGSFYRQRKADFSQLRPSRLTCGCTHGKFIHQGWQGMCMEKPCACQKFRAVGLSKYKNQRAEHDGAVYHSKKERDYAAVLDLRLKAKDIKSWRRQIPFRLSCSCGEFSEVYILDFEVTNNDGTLEFIEVKGFAKREGIKKWQRFVKQYSPKYPTATFRLEKV